MDDYKARSGEITTSAMGEGAIEGVAADYEVRGGGYGLGQQFGLMYSLGTYALVSAPLLSVHATRRPHHACTVSDGWDVCHRVQVLA